MEQHAWASQQAAGNAAAFWRGMRLVLAQLDGMVAGYAERAVQAQRAHHAGRWGGMELPELGLRDFLFMSGVGELGEHSSGACAMRALHPSSVGGLAGLPGLGALPGGLVR